MFTKKRNEVSFNVWPCFVDALSSLLIVIVFAIIGSFVLQVYLSSILRDTDISLKELQHRFSALQSQYANKDVENKRLLHDLYAIQNLISQIKTSETKLKIENFNLNTQISEFLSKINALTSLLATEREEFAQKKSSLENDMSVAIREKVEQLKQLRAELDKLKEQIPPSILQNPELLKYRSEFFATLQEILGGRSDIRTVGDRFVFQSEVLFAKGSDELGEQGKIALDMLAKILIDISEKIPANINWILRVDGHTDMLPIHNDRFDSNWELSTSRAICVVKYLESKGISPKHLAAAGFAEHYPLTMDTNKMAKNRRIEIRFDSI
ncbi:MAG: OmpA family protein [Holosporales bacterium]|jgi:chemotaxis protein MotB|nr:OmpA family protein [Holosporales bacterium]